MCIVDIKTVLRNYADQPRFVVLQLCRNYEIKKMNWKRGQVLRESRGFDKHGFEFDFRVKNI